MNLAPLRVLIVDDEAPARNRLRDLLADLASEERTEIVGMLANGREALDFLSGRHADVIFLDVRMPVIDGVDCARRLATLADPPSVIFVTAYDGYAVQAFDLAVTDYLVKPVRAQRLVAALVKVRQERARLSPLGHTEPRDSLVIVERSRITRLPVADVLYFQAESKYTVACTRDREYLLDESLTLIEAEFPHRFLRIHRNCLVAKAAVTGLCQQPRASGDLSQGGWEIAVLGRTERLAVSRRLVPAVRKALGA